MSEPGHKRRPTGLLWLGGALVLLALVAIVVINAPGVSALYYVTRYGALVDALPSAPTFQAGDRLLVVAPHPDDESLCCAGTIQQARTVGAEVFIVWLTSGDAFEFDAALTERTLDPRSAGLQRLGERRIGEARAAAQALAVPDDHLFFLGYPDGGLQRLLLDYDSQPYRSTYTGLTAVSYAVALSPGAAFTGESRCIICNGGDAVALIVVALFLDDRHPTIARPGTPPIPRQRSAATARGDRARALQLALPRGAACGFCSSAATWTRPAGCGSTPAPSRRRSSCCDAAHHTHRVRTTPPWRRCSANDQLRPDAVSTERATSGRGTLLELGDLSVRRRRRSAWRWCSRALGAAR